MDTDRSKHEQTIVSHPFAATLIRIKARQLCRRCDHSKSDYEDLCQEMRIYLVQKAQLFDPARGNIEAFITNALNTWIAMRLRHRGRKRRCESRRDVSLEGTPVECEGDIVSLGSVLLQEDGRRRTLADPISPTERFELREALEHALSQLEPEDNVMLAEVVEHGISGCARKRGVSRRQINNALARLRPLFEKALGRDE